MLGSRPGRRVGYESTQDGPCLGTSSFKRLSTFQGAPQELISPLGVRNRCRPGLLSPFAVAFQGDGQQTTAMECGSCLA